MTAISRQQRPGFAWETVPESDPLLLSSPSVVPLPRDSIVETIFAAGHGYTAASGSTGTLTDDTSVYLLGSQSLKITTPAGASTAHETARKNSNPAINGTGKYLAMTIMVDRPDLLGALRLDVSSDSFTNWSSADIISPTTNATLPFLVPDEWITVVIPWGAYAVGGGAGATRSAITSYQVRAQDDGNGTAVNVWVNKISFVDEPPSAVITLTWDDGWGGQFLKAKPIMDAYDFKGSFGPIVGYIGEPEFMTYEQNLALVEQGWDPCAHAYDTSNHVNYATISDEEAIQDARNAKNWMQRQLGICDNFIIPEGALTTLERSEAFADLFNFSRTSYTRVRETWPPSRRQGVRSYTFSQAHSVSDIEAKIDEAIANREWLILEGHNVVDAAPTQTDYLTADFQSVMDYIFAKGVPVRTFAEMAADGPPARGVRVDVNAIGQGLRGQNYDRILAANSSVFVSGTIFLVALPLLRGDVVTNMHIAIQTAGSAWTSTLAKIGLYTVGGVQLGLSANQTTAWDTVGVKSQALTTAYVSPSDQLVYAAIIDVGSGTTAPAMARANSNTNMNAAVSPGARPVAALTGQTDLGTPISIASGNGIGFWVGWS